MHQNSSSLPLVRAPPDALRFGFYSASEDVRPLHEVQRLQTTVRARLQSLSKCCTNGSYIFFSCLMQQRQSNWELKMATVEQIYGKAAAMRLRTEKSVLEQFTVSEILWFSIQLMPVLVYMWKEQAAHYWVVLCSVFPVYRVRTLVWILSQAPMNKLSSRTF